MKTKPSKAKNLKTNHPFEVVKVGSISIPIYSHANIIPQRDAQTGAILYDSLPDGKRKALVKYQSAIYTVAYYQGTKRVRQKFSDLAKARREAELIAIKWPTAKPKSSNSMAATGQTMSVRCKNFANGSQTLISTLQ